ncbi:MULTISPECIES: hypothetical protein [unclassified Ensifer]|uniref:hypothetical protein n=1 Tax=unclassified Ensifer TaxID=2633371 RepID=UPI0008131A65|nr:MULTISPECIES: hypothetical protein [unclassified Ensifer]OCP22446.1 hypothetical protein BC361_24650 [Ensifer sp. LC54]OCP22656.1 hypothetical protein BC363_26785 [Ensifer sp. LC384]
MKPEKKPFVVEIKNRRRLSRREHSIWGKIDLKAAGDQVAAVEKSAENGAAMPMRHPEAAPEQNAAEINV